MHVFEEYWVVGTTANINHRTLQWNTEAEAIEEAKRLAEYYPTVTFIVFKAVAKVALKLPTSVERVTCRTATSQS